MAGADDDDVVQIASAYHANPEADALASLNGKLKVAQSWLSGVEGVGSLPKPMVDDPRTLEFGVTFDSVVSRIACGQLLTLSAHLGHDRNPPHQHANDFICIVLTGSFAERQRDDWRERRTGAYFVHHAGEIHHDWFGPRGAVCLSLHFAHKKPRPGNSEGVCSTTARLAAYRLAFELTARGGDELEVAGLTAQIMAELGSHCGGERDDGKWIGKVVEAIADEPGRRWRLNELAVIAGRHPVHLAQAFRARTGMTLGTFQRLRRLVGLSLAIRRNRGPLAMLASDFGYCDQSHMNAEFRAAFGVSPGRYRRAVH